MTSTAPVDRPPNGTAPTDSNLPDKRGDHTRDEQGAVTVMLVLLAVAMLAVAGLVIDGGYALGSRRHAMSTAEQAARAGSDALSQASLRSGDIRVNPDQAAAAAQAYLERADATGTVRVRGGEVIVTVTSTYRTVLLNAVGVASLPISATAEAMSIDDTDTRAN